MLTQIELDVMSAVDNEAMTITPYQRDQEFLHHVNAWKNAAVYADQYGYSVAEFRATITKLYHYWE
jgi:hypothetical protein